MDRADQSAEFDAAHQSMNAFVRGVHRRAVVEKKENAGDDLDNKKEQANPSEIIPDRMLVFGNLLFFGEFEEGRQLEAVVDISQGIFEKFFHRIMSSWR